MFVLADVPIGLIAMLAGAAFIAGIVPAALLLESRRRKRRHIARTHSTFIRWLWIFGIVATGAGGLAIAFMALAIYDIPSGMQMTLLIASGVCLAASLVTSLALVCYASVASVRLSLSRCDR